MVSAMAAIELGKIPWQVAMFGLDHWKTAVAAFWGLGFAYILMKNMRMWIKQDAYDASIGKRDEGEIYDGIKEVARERRPTRIKEVFTKMLFWLPIAAWNLGKKIAMVIFYPILAHLDKEQMVGIEKGKKGLPMQAPSNAIPSDAHVILTEGENAVKCSGCGFLVPTTHICSKPASSGPMISDDRPVRRKTVKCDDCEEAVPLNSPHACGARREDQDLENGLIRCECGTTYKEEDDFEHTCPDEEDEEDMSTVQCKDCDKAYNPADEVHAATYCRGCTDVHCKKYSCGQLV